MKKYMIDSNILYSFEKLVRTDGKEVYPEWLDSIQSLWNSFQNGEVDLYLPRGSWTESVGATEDADDNANVINFIGKYFSSRIMPKTTKEISDSYLVSCEYKNKGGIFKSKSNDDRLIAGECAVCNMDLITYNGKDFGFSRDSERARKIADFNKSLGYDSSPVSPDEAIQEIMQSIKKDKNTEIQMGE